MTLATLPAITLGASEYCRLRAVAREATDQRHPVGSFLSSELQRADIVSDAEVPKNQVRMEAWVTFRTDWRWTVERRVLVYPEDWRREESELSVLTPLGAALIGLPVGAWMPYQTPDGRDHVAMAESVALRRRLPSLFGSWRRPRAAKPDHDPDDSGPFAA
jgi:regulator of nucleoside diphosphate kinase